MWNSRPFFRVKTCQSSGKPKSASSQRAACRRNCERDLRRALRANEERLNFHQCREIALDLGCEENILTWDESMYLSTYRKRISACYDAWSVCCIPMTVNLPRGKFHAAYVGTEYAPNFEYSSDGTVGIASLLQTYHDAGPTHPHDRDNLTSPLSGSKRAERYKDHWRRVSSARSICVGSNAAPETRIGPKRVLSSNDHDYATP